MKKLKSELIQAMNLNKNISSENLLETLTKRVEEENVQKIIDEYCNNLLIGLSNIIDIFEPQAICFGGSFVYFAKVLYEVLLKKYYEKRYVFNKQNMPELKLAKLGNNAGIIGASMLKS